MSVFALDGIGAIGLCALALVMHGSLTHEVVHGHPFRSRRASEALVVINPGLFIPYRRFRDLHLAHHRDSRLTDPYDDPETNYLCSEVWSGLCSWRKRLYRWNNTLLGRMLIGPVLSQAAFMASDSQAILAGDTKVLRAWLIHLPGVVFVLGAVFVAGMPVWHYLIACYAALSILKIRTFVEHQAHECPKGRTVVVEDRGVLAFLFLNNNLHVVHHMHPGIAWYHLPRLYRENRARFLKRNGGYVFPGYGAIFRAYFLRAKDPVPHPLWPSR